MSESFTIFCFFLSVSTKRYRVCTILAGVGGAGYIVRLQQQFSSNLSDVASRCEPSLEKKDGFSTRWPSIDVVSIAEVTCFLGATLPVLARPLDVHPQLHCHLSCPLPIRSENLGLRR